MKTIKEIAAVDTFPVRNPVLRPGKPIESCHFEGDNDATTRHFGVFIDDELVGVTSLFKISNENFDNIHQLQMRGMAVSESHRKQHLGESLVVHAEQYAKNSTSDLIWFNARIVAVPFYEKMGYKIHGSVFEIPTVGPHLLMYKNLSHA